MMVSSAARVLLGRVRSFGGPFALLRMTSHREMITSCEDDVLRRREGVLRILGSGADMIPVNVTAWEIHYLRRSRRNWQEHADAEACGGAARGWTQSC